MSGEAGVTSRDIVYRSPATGDLLARLYQPSPGSWTGLLPAVVSVHGGRWVSQSRTTNEVIDTALARAGVVVMAIDFRMPPAAMYPEPVADINFAIRWLKARAEEFGSAPDRVGGIGTSSGGHQLMLNALRPNDERYAAIGRIGEAVDANLAFVVAAWPVLDPLARYRMAKEKNMERHILSHDAYWPDEAAMAEGNPQLILERGERVQRPPLLLVQGLDDRIVPPAMTQRFAETYRASGGIADLSLHAGQGHTFITKNPDAEASQQAIRAITDFVTGQAGKTSTAPASRTVAY
jgi:acetyl esterase